MEPGHIVLPAGLALLILGAAGVAVIYPALCTDGATFEAQVTSAGDFADYDEGDKLRLLDTIARMQENEQGQTAIWFESSGKGDNDLRIRFDDDLSDRFGPGNTISITVKVVKDDEGNETLAGYDSSAGAVEPGAIKARYTSPLELLFAVLALAGAGTAGYGGFLMLRRAPQEADDWDMGMEGAAWPQPAAPPGAPLAAPPAAAPPAVPPAMTPPMAQPPAAAPPAAAPAAAPPAAPPAAMPPVTAPPAAAAQPVTIQCPSCAVQLRVNDPTRPLNVTCPGCQSGLVLR